MGICQNLSLQKSPAQIVTFPALRTVTNSHGLKPTPETLFKQQGGEGGKLDQEIMKCDCEVARSALSFCHNFTQSLVAKH